MSRPRIRTIKPDMWADEKVGVLSRDARLLFVNLITLADDEGRLRDLPTAIVGHCYPYDTDASVSIHGWINEVVQVGLAQRYRVADQGYLVLPGFARHQVINRPRPSELPAPPGFPPLPQPPDGSFTDTSVNDHGNVSDASRSGREGKGKERRTSPNPAKASFSGEQDHQVKAAPEGNTITRPLKALGTNPRARGTNPRARGTNPRARASAQVEADWARTAAFAAALIEPPASAERAGWERLHAAIRAATPPSAHASWLEDVDLVGAQGGTLVLDAPDSARPWLVRPHVQRMVQACAASVGVRARLATGAEHDGLAA